ncbi:MAG: hypothetical protein ACKOSS_08730 [Planctomycetia bacterium]
MATPEPAPPAPGVPLGTARAEAARLLGRLERNASALRLAVAGATRRMAPRVERLDLLATAHEAAPLLEALASAPRVRAVRGRSAQHVEVELDAGLGVRLEVLPDEQDFVPALVRATGPQAHVQWLEARAHACGLAWQGHALEGPQGRLALLEEDDLYAALGLERPVPERREAWLPGMEAGAPLAMQEVCGVSGVAVREAGGRYPLADVAGRAAREGYAWLLATLPRGCEAGAASALAQAAAACHDAGADRAPVRLSREQAPGDLPAPGDPLALRLLRAPWAGAAQALALAPVDALLVDPPGEAPAEPVLAGVLAALARHGTALAVRPPPHHPQPEPQVLERALAAGVPLLLQADAHDLVGLDDLVLCVGLARRAGATAPQVLNAWPLAQLDAWLAARRERA